MQRQTNRERLASNPRASLVSWERYASTVERAFNEFPRPFEFEPLSLLPSTVESRIRDAIRGCIEFDYPRTFAKGVALRDWYEKVTVRHSIAPPRVIIAPLSKEATPPLDIELVTRQSKGIEVSECSQDEFNAFCLLVNNGKLNGPVKILKPIRYVENPALFNVQTMLMQDGTLVIL